MWQWRSVLSSICTPVINDPALIEEDRGGPNTLARVSSHLSVWGKPVIQSQLLQVSPLALFYTTAV